MASAPGAAEAAAFYAGAYGGGLSEKELNSVLPAALRLTGWLCGGREPTSSLEEEAWNRAVCAAADVLAEVGTTPSPGFTLGSFSFDGQGASGVELARAAAGRELMGTRLGFCGVR